jgi:hypothetical protein
VEKLFQPLRSFTRRLKGSSAKLTLEINALMFTLTENLFGWLIFVLY